MVLARLQRERDLFLPGCHGTLHVAIKQPLPVEPEDNPVVTAQAQVQSGGFLYFHLLVEIAGTKVRLPEQPLQIERLAGRNDHRAPADRTAFALVGGLQVDFLFHRVRLIQPAVFKRADEPPAIGKLH